MRLERNTTRTARTRGGIDRYLDRRVFLAGLVVLAGAFAAPSRAQLVDPVFKTKSSSGKITITGFTAAGSGPLVIPATISNEAVVAIGDEAFYNHPELTGVTIPSGVTSIGIYSFASCPNLASATIPNTVTTIGQGAFLDTALAAIAIPNSVTSMGDFAFYNCVDLASLSLGSGLTSIGNYVFDGCTALAGSITLPNSATSIGDFAFQACPNITRVVFGPNVTAIGAESFEDCSSLSTAALPPAITTIGESAFAGTALTTVVFPSTVTEIDAGAYQGAALTSAYFLGNAPATTGADIFTSEASGFKVYYYSTATGFTSPTWTYYSGATPASSAPAANLGTPALAFTSAASASFKVGQANAFTVAASGRPAATFTASGLPSWATLNATSGVLSGIPPSAANAPFTVTMTASDGVLPAATQTFTLNVQTSTGPTLLTFAQWEAQPGFFSSTQLADPAVSGPTAIPLHDGLPNLIKYLYNINPSRPMTADDRAALPVVAITTASGNNYLTVTYRQYAGETGITIRPQSSTQLQAWTDLTLSTASLPKSGTYTLQAVAIDPNTADPIMQIELLLTAPNEFSRIDVTLP